MEKFYGQFEPPVDQFIFERYFPEKGMKGVFVECGAYDGLADCSCKFFEETLGWTGFNIEPLPWLFEDLCKHRPESRNLMLALSNVSGQGEFTAYLHPELGRYFGNGSLTHTEPHTRHLLKHGATPFKVDVGLISWVDFIAQENIRHVDLLVLDVEGHELFVFEGMKGAAVLPDVICVEIGHLDWGLIRETMAELGYVYDTSSEANAYFVKTELLGLFALRRQDHLLRRNGELQDEIKVLSEGIARTAEAEGQLVGEARDRAHRLENEITRLHEEHSLQAARIAQLQGHIDAIEGVAASLERRARDAETALDEVHRSKAWGLIQAYRKLLR